jgi:L-fucose isomerase-like protein
VQEELLALAAAAQIRAALRDVRVGSVGMGCPGMLGVDFDEVALASIGPQLVRLELTDLLARAERTPATAVDKLVGDLRGQPGLREPGDEDLSRSIRLYTAFRSLVEEHDLQAIGVRCWPELRVAHGCTPCLAFSRLMDDGVMGVCENDPAAGVTMLIGHWLSQQPVFLGDVSAVDADLNAIRLWHCGAASTDLACDGCQVEYRHNRALPLGVQVEFPLRAGRVTLSKLSRPVNGRARLFVAAGEVIESPQVRGNAAVVRLDAALAQAMEAILSYGIEHHLVLAYGDHTRQLRHLGRLLDLDLVEAGPTPGPQLPGVVA